MMGAKGHLYFIQAGMCLEVPAAHHLKSEIKKNECTLRDVFTYRHFPEFIVDLLAGSDYGQFKPVIDWFELIGILLGHLLDYACNSPGVTALEFQFVQFPQEIHVIEKAFNRDPEDAPAAADQEKEPRP